MNENPDHNEIIHKNVTVLKAYQDGDQGAVYKVRYKEKDVDAVLKVYPAWQKASYEKERDTMVRLTELNISKNRFPQLYSTMESPGQQYEILMQQLGSSLKRVLHKKYP